MAELKIIKNKADESVIAALEDLLVHAKDGKLIEFDLVGRYESGQVLNSWAGDCNDVYTMFGKMMERALWYRDRNIEK